MIFIDTHHDLNLCSFYGNPTEISAMDRAYFKI